MSRIGKRPITVPKGVTISAPKDGYVEVKGPKGTLRRPFHSSLTFEEKDGVAMVSVAGEKTAEAGRFHGTTRALLAGAIIGVSDGFKKNIKLEGTGYKAELKGTILNLSLGLSHPVAYDMPKAISVRIPPESKGTVILLESPDKALLGQTVANLQSFRPPEPYKGKGVTVEGQKIRRKAGKAGKAGGKK